MIENTVVYVGLTFGPAYPEACKPVPLRKAIMAYLTAASGLVKTHQMITVLREAGYKPTTIASMLMRLRQRKVIQRLPGGFTELVANLDKGDGHAADTTRMV